MHWGEIQNICLSWRQYYSLGDFLLMAMIKPKWKQENLAGQYYKHK